MIKPRLSLERFELNLKIQQKISNLHGYRLQNSQYSPKSRSSQKKQASFVINKSINPLDVRQKQIEKSQRLRQLIKQIQQLEMQKQIQKMIQRNNNKEVNMVQLLNGKIREYNYLIQHKHLINKKSRSMFSSKGNRSEQKQDGYYIEKLVQKQKQLNRTNSLMTRINKNKQIASIYKDYSQTFKLNKHYYKMQPVQKQKIKKQENNGYKNVKIKQLLENINNINKPPQEDENPDIQYPYVNKRYLDNLSDFNDELRRSKNISKIFKQKLNKVQSLNNSEIITTSNNQLQSDFNFQELTLKEDLDQMYDRIGRKVSNNDQQEKSKERLKYCLLGLRKRSPKYIKAEDSKFVTHYNVEKIAKQMVAGPPSPQNKKQVKLNIPKMYKRKLKIPEHLPQEDKEVMEYMIQEQDDTYYWTTCRNQKINLLLKGKIHR